MGQISLLLALFTFFVPGNSFSLHHVLCPCKTYFAKPGNNWKLLASSSSGGSSSNNNYDDNSIQVASTLLSWELLEESSKRPVLNLSGRDDSPENNNNTINKPDTSDWDQGQLWGETKQGLIDRGISDPDSCLTACPQLLRLAPSMVLESADFVIQEYGLAYLELEPRLLTFQTQHISYGLEFMSTMMMADAKAACTVSSSLLLSGIEGGIQEQAVQKALKLAGEATNNANQRIAGDAMSALQSLKKRKGL